MATLTPDGRASDADRNAVVERLILAHAEGRLDIHEFEDRVASALAAKTYGELEAITADLPEAAPSADLPATSTAGRTRRRRAPKWLHSASGWRGLGVVTVGMIAIDILNAPGNPTETPLQYPPNPWPLLVALPWAGALVARTIRSRARAVPRSSLSSS